MVPISSLLYVNWTVVWLMSCLYIIPSFKPYFTLICSNHLELNVCISQVFDAVSSFFLFGPSKTSISEACLIKFGYEGFAMDCNNFDELNIKFGSEFCHLISSQVCIQKYN